MDIFVKYIEFELKEQAQSMNYYDLICIAFVHKQLELFLDEQPYLVHFL